MAGLAAALVRNGCNVTYVAGEQMSAERAKQGWSAPNMPGVTLVVASAVNEIHHHVNNAPPDSVHICQGIRSNGLVGAAQRAVRRRSLRQWVVMETVDDNGWRGALKRLEYRRLFMVHRQHLQGVLCIGESTPGWVVARGVNANCVFPFAYFLPDRPKLLTIKEQGSRPFRFIFAGQLIPRKRVDWLISALAGLADPAFELWIVGAGPEEVALRALAQNMLGDRVRWLGQLPLTDVPAVMAQGDCLVLPSVHDGWGAVVSEALMAGTPVVCSDACGSAGVVRASGCGGVFRSDDRAMLSMLLGQALVFGRTSSSVRDGLADWAECLGGGAGAAYLLQILDFVDGAHANAARPLQPWSATHSAACREIGHGE